MSKVHGSAYLKWSLA
ncbi:hypothetical protein F383_09956 [Gossypium arboreum]|uniref:Uncharacterized protein n=1 Tax=Gossypium arboreum TaxID=29729 RepID=A0A0B0PA70_GOSAR|nr:hypothetical protein F383_09956 [Gossypium arboreum]